MKYYKLTKKRRVNSQGIVLYQIEATKDLLKHGVKKGDLGGWIESVYLKDGKLRIQGDAWILDNAELFNEARLLDFAKISDNARVFEDAKVSGNAKVCCDAKVFGNAEIYGNALVNCNSKVSGHAKVFGNANVFCDVEVSGNAMVGGSTKFLEDYSDGYSYESITGVVMDGIDEIFYQLDDLVESRSILYEFVKSITINQYMKCYLDTAEIIGKITINQARSIYNTANAVMKVNNEYFILYYLPELIHLDSELNCINVVIHIKNDTEMVNLYLYGNWIKIKAGFDSNEEINLDKLPQNIKIIHGKFLDFYPTTEMPPWKIFIEKVFDYKFKSYFNDEMCMDISVYEKRIMNYSKKDIAFFGKLGQFLFKSTVENIYNFMNDAEDLMLNYNITSEASLETAHSLIHATKLFKEKGGGLLSLFLFSEPESWEKLPIINKNLYNEMPITDQKVYDDLPAQVTIYRGTSLREYNNGNFGQSWSLKESVAYHFAFSLHPENDSGWGRVILAITISKKDILAYSNHNNEQLCIVNTKKIIPKKIKIIKK